ncbi:hypothetical protein GGR50DRAFT_518700 [Xylaria sp. CBS 124048]|nr:hypothetical protein GGR50DRAFT_518700 [Xylaria sp. CBS 124048]
MPEERVPATSGFELLDYTYTCQDSPLLSSTGPDLLVMNSAFWSYCGPLITTSDDLPLNFHEWSSTSLSAPLLPQFMPLLEFVNKVVRERGLNHYWLTIRATKATSEFDKPRWHTDDMFFTTSGRGLRMMQRQDDGRRNLGLQTDWKLCTTLLGPSTVFISPECQAEARKLLQSTKEELTTDHNCTSIRCIACAATADAVRERLAEELKHMGTIHATRNECAFFHIGPDKGAVHSEPCMSDGDRIFVNVVPGRTDELRSLMAKWGMSFPRSWWIAPNLLRSHT